MSELGIIETALRQAASRRRWQRAWRGFWRGVLTGSLIWLGTLGLYKITPLPLLSLAVAGVLFFVASLAGFLAGWWRRDDLAATARWLDEKETLQERLSTAWEVARDARAGRWRELLVSDAARQVARLDLRRLLPFQLPKACSWALLVLALGAGLGFVPEYRSQAFVQQQREQDAVRDAGRNLAEISRRTLDKRQPTLEGAKAAVNSVGELGAQLKQTPPPRSQAMRELAKMTEKVQQQSRELARNPALRAMEKAANNSSRNQPAGAERLQKQIEAMQKTLGSKNANADALDKLQQELQKAQQAAANMAANGSAASDAAKESLAKSLANLARQAQEMGAALPSLDEAIAALDAGRVDQMLKDLAVAEKDLEKLKELAQAIQQMQQQAQQLGKNLAEQLKNGQAAAAAETLQKMVNQLKAGNLAAEQLKQILEEVTQAIQPAGEYGDKVAELLKQARQQMQAGDKAGAAQSLADAAKELQNLMDQMADAQDVKSMLDALKRAQACVGTGQGWGQCMGDKAGFNPGGKPSKGVGTWADESQWFDTAPNTGAWDNSGVERPDMDSRGVSDRDLNLPDNMAATKVKGQFSPGGPMPSITLKGVSLKGQSTVAIQEAVTAAQSEAQSALSQEQVPRAYQGAVKDYFDDLKK